ncbi:N-acetyltransferase [Brevundimonas sp. Leaf363]|uniref:N-acetyltransferase n=1 Tax=Brevundimonas sp. Leaf363 TaxID=1736353 RepID=UPI000AEC7330|nr:N-acetyltransferase [Brevundimonas sp. Leaf363]
MSVRPVHQGDYADVNALHRAVWWPERSSAGWRWLEDNPARQALDAPVGYVVQDRDGVARAFVGNMIQRFWQDGREYFGAQGFSIVVPPELAGCSRGLIRSVCRQDGVFSVFTFNANPASARLYPRFDLKPFPDTHALKLSWVIDPLACLTGRVLRGLVKRAPGLARPLGERLMSPRLGDVDGLKLPDWIEVVTDLSDGSDYGRFWDTLKAEGRMVADRSPEAMRWRVSDPDQTLAPLLLAYRRDGRIIGYAYAQIGKGNAIEPPFLEIIDLIALEGERDAVFALARTLLDNAQALAVAKVRLQVVNPELLEALGPLVRTARREGGWGHCHAWFDPDGPGGDQWAPTPFDGDYSFCTRPAPLRTAGRTAGQRVPAPQTEGKNEGRVAKA